MPKFNQIAQAALTPHGAQAGVNDLVAAIMNADAQKFKAAEAAKAQGAQSSLEQAKLSEMIRSNMAGEKLRGQGQTMEGQQHAGTLGETIRHNTAMEGRPYGPQGSAALDEARNLETDWRNANIGQGLDPDEGTGWIEQKSYGPLDINMETPILKQVRGPAPADKVKARDEAFRAARALRASGGPKQGVDILSGAGMVAHPAAPKTATEPQSPGASPTPAPLGPPASARPPIDYEGLDAKFQATSPKYKQMRSDPSFDWKKFVESRAQ